AFLFLIDYAARMLRPVSLAGRVGKYGLEVMESVYPEQSSEEQDIAGSRHSPGSVEGTILHRGKSAIVVAVNVETLVAEAEKAEGVIEFAPRVGDFAGPGEPLFLLHDGADAIDERKLRASVVLGDERTMVQDPLFGFRILVDIAIKALSKAINDPTTAVLAIDQLHQHLRSAGRRNLRTDQILDRAGKLRLIFRTPNWEDCVHLACSEIRFYGAENMQIARRMRAMIVNLIDTLPAQRHSALRKADEKPGHDGLTRPRIIGEQKAQRLTWEHDLVDGRDLVRQRFDEGSMYGEHWIEQMCQTDTMRLRNKSKQMAVTVKAPRAAVLDYFEARLVMTIKQLVSNTARWPLVGQLKRLGTKPLHADHRDDLIRQNASDCGGGLEVF